MSDDSDFCPTSNNSDDDSDYNERVDEHNSSDVTSDHDAVVSSEEEEEDPSEEEVSSSDDDEEDDNNALRRQLFKDILQENVTYKELKKSHIQNLGRALFNEQDDKITTFAATHYPSRYEEAVYSELQNKLEGRLRDELQTRQNRGGCSSFFSPENSEFLSQVFSYVLCANCVVPAVNNTLIEMVNADTTYIADCILEKASAASDGNDISLLLSKRAVGASAEVLRVLQNTTNIEVDCRPRSKTTHPSQVRRTADRIIYGCSVKAVPQDNEVKVCVSYKKEGQVVNHLYACVPKNTSLKNVLPTMIGLYQDIQKDFSNIDSTLYLKEPLDPFRRTRLIKIDNDMEVQCLPRNTALYDLALLGDHQEIYKPMLSINEHIMELRDINKNTKGNDVWDDVLGEMFIFIHFNLIDAHKREFKFTFRGINWVSRAPASQVTRLRPKSKLRDLRQRFMKEFFNPFSKLQRKCAIPKNLFLGEMKITIDYV